MLEFIKTINSDYAGVFSLISSLIMVVVTIIYVGHTKQQADSAKDSVKLITEQMKKEKQPCVIPYIMESYGTAFDANNYTRVQLTFDINLRNVGDAPAINVYTLAEFELQFQKDKAGNKKRLSAALLPRFVQSLSAGEEEKIHVWFETDEIRNLIIDLAKAEELNIERIKNNPHQNPFTGGTLVVRILFKNIMGQWCESTLSHDIAWLKFTKTSFKDRKKVGESIISINQVYVGDEMEAVLTARHLAPFDYRMIDDEYVKDVLSDYGNDNPWIVKP